MKVQSFVDILGADFYTGVPIQYISDNEKRILEEKWSFYEYNIS